jgi:hypothetical protein
MPQLGDASGAILGRLVFLTLVHKNGLALFAQLYRAERYSHFYFVQCPFVPGPAIQPHPTVGHPGFVFQLSAGFKNGI